MFEFEPIDYWDASSEASSDCCHDIISPTSSSEADDDEEEKRNDMHVSPLFPRSPSPLNEQTPVPPRRKSTLRSSPDLSSTISPWGLSMILPPTPKLRKTVGFSGTDRVVLIPARADYDEETKSLMWWTYGDYNEFQKAAKIDSERCNRDWSQLPDEDEETPAAVEHYTTIPESFPVESLSVDVSGLLTQEEKHAALVSFLSHRPVYRPDSPTHGLPLGAQLAEGAVEVECEEVAHRDEEEDVTEVRGLSHSVSCPSLHDQADELADDDSSLTLELPDLVSYETHHSPHQRSPKYPFSPRSIASPQRLFRIMDTLDLAGIPREQRLGASSNNHQGPMGNGASTASPCAHNSRRLAAIDVYARGRGRRSLDDLTLRQAAAVRILPDWRVSPPSISAR